MDRISNNRPFTKENRQRNRRDLEGVRRIRLQYRLAMALELVERMDAPAAIQYYLQRAQNVLEFSIARGRELADNRANRRDHQRTA